MFIFRNDKWKGPLNYMFMYLQTDIVFYKCLKHDKPFPDNIGYISLLVYKCKIWAELISVADKNYYYFNSFSEVYRIASTIYCTWR